MSVSRNHSTNPAGNSQNSLAPRSEGDHLQVLRAVLQRSGMLASKGRLDFDDASSIVALSATGLRSLDALESAFAPAELRNVLADCHILRDLPADRHADFITDKLIGPLRALVAGRKAVRQ